MSELEKKKEQAKIELSNNSSKITSITIGKMTFQVLPNGKKGYAYIIHNDLYELDLAQFRSKNADLYPVFVRVKSEALWSMGIYEVVVYILEWIKENIGEVMTTKVSRVDLCCHTDKFVLNEQDIDNFKGEYYTDTVYRYRRAVNAMTFGSSATGKVYCRIYDKVLEIENKKQKTWFYNIWKQHNMNCSRIWNIEFQVNRDFLKQWNIETVHELYDHLSAIWQFCTEKWLVKIINDNEDKSKCPIDSKWLIVQEAFCSLSYQPLIRREDQLREDAEAMIPGTFGYLTSFAAKKGVDNIETAVHMLVKSGERYLKEKNMSFKLVVSKKRKVKANFVSLPEGEY
jgi:hypothetical protein